MTSTSDRRLSFLTLTQPDRAFWFVFCKLDEPIFWPQRVKYDDQDAKELAQVFADHPVLESVTFGRLWSRRDRGVLILIQEGVLTKWFSGRVVLAGDAAHKMTPNIGLGGNTGIESVVAACNQIVQMLDQTKGRLPSLDTIEHCFKSYQDEHQARVESIASLSRLITRVQAWDTPPIRWLAEWVMPMLPDRALADFVSEYIRAAPKLEYVSTIDTPTGAVAPRGVYASHTASHSRTVVRGVSVILTELNEENVTPTQAGFPTVQPAIITKVNATPTCTIETVPKFEPAFKAEVNFGVDWLSFDSDGTHGRIDLRGIAKTEEGHSIDFRYQGIIKMAPEVKKIFGMQPDAVTVPFGFATGQHQFLVADPALKKLENGVFVINGRIVVHEKGLTVETRQSLVIAATVMD
ncbi:hypothetical protein CORC01_06635 [Colletotrichum orchidophilum]|uniref:FAD-binding domain-containing protein n=1 Tax=Colletotrichum orchidophilum TaxID=1209926 RepID=A0A1G4B9Q0_9PEZI|nr:uncharacterized protein CORC01_06635 [Colletotrichum orchidophilum]OHE98121.1 hypothetical protein CORC01_06635 [Colletotrichum orchidophilum]